MSKLAKEALLDEIVAAIDVNKNGLIDMKLGGNLTTYDKSGLQNTCHFVAILMSLDFNGFYIYFPVLRTLLFHFGPVFLRSNFCSHKLVLCLCN